MANTKKQVTFDLDTKALEKYYPTKSWNNAYDIIKKYMLGNGFIWLQGSVYVSEKQVSSAKMTNIQLSLVESNPWLNLYMRDCRETNIGREHSKNHIFDRNADIPIRKD